MNTEYFFIHRGERTELANAELRALVKTYHPQATIRNLNERVSIVKGDIDIKKITSRAACTKYAGKLLGFSVDDKLTFDPDGHFRNYKKFVCKLINLSKKNLTSQSLNELGRYIKEKSPWMQVSLLDPEITLLQVVTDNGSVFGLAEFKNKINWTKNRLRNRPYFHPVALKPVLGRIMVNLTMAKEGDTLLDPFCGTGSIILEAAKMKIRTLGCDLSSSMCHGALENTRSKESCIMNADALSLPFHSGVDVIATDLPYGRSASTMKRSAKTLLKDFVTFVNSEMKHKRCCIMCRKGDEEFFDSMVEEYDIYEHRNLTRKLMVLCS